MLVHEYFYFIVINCNCSCHMYQFLLDPPWYKTGRIDHISAANTAATAIHDIPCYDAYMGRVWGTDTINKPANKLNILIKSVCHRNAKNRVLCWCVCTLLTTRTGEIRC